MTLIKFIFVLCLCVFIGTNNLYAADNLQTMTIQKAKDIISEEANNSDWYVKNRKGFWDAIVVLAINKEYSFMEGYFNNKKFVSMLEHTRGTKYSWSFLNDVLDAIAIANPKLAEKLLIDGVNASKSFSDLAMAKNKYFNYECIYALRLIIKPDEKSVKKLIQLYNKLPTEDSLRYPVFLALCSFDNASAKKFTNNLILNSPKSKYETKLLLYLRKNKTNPNCFIILCNAFKYFKSKTLGGLILDNSGIYINPENTSEIEYVEGYEDVAPEHADEYIKHLVDIRERLIDLLPPHRKDNRQIPIKTVVDNILKILQKVKTKKKPIDIFSLNPFIITASNKLEKSQEPEVPREPEEEPKQTNKNGLEHVIELDLENDDDK